jgi:hypothetical protein
MSADTVLKTFNQAIDVVLKEPVGPRRWRAANTFWLNLSPKHKAQYQAVIKENAETRKALAEVGNKFGTSEDRNSSLRYCLNIPSGAYYAIERADPDAFRKKSNASKFFREFKEYTTAEVY